MSQKWEIVSDTEGMFQIAYFCSKRKVRSRWEVHENAAYYSHAQKDAECVQSVQRCTLHTLECHIGDVGEAWCNRLSVLANILLPMAAAAFN